MVEGAEETPSPKETQEAGQGPYGNAQDSFENDTYRLKSQISSTCLVMRYSDFALFAFSGFVVLEFGSVGSWVDHRRHGDYNDGLIPFRSPQCW